VIAGHEFSFVSTAGIFAFSDEYICVPVTTETGDVVTVKIERMRSQR